MSVLLKQLEEQARTLSAEERAKLVEFMLESSHPLTSDIEAAWEAEIKRRVTAFDCSELPAYGAEDVFAAARRISRPPR